MSAPNIQDAADASYLAAIRSRLRLTREEEIVLATRCQNGDEAAAAQLIASQMPAVIRIARRYSQYGMPVNDLVHEGVIGLIQAVKRFNPDQNARLSTYAIWWIRAAVQEHVIRSWSLVRIGTTTAQKALFFRVRRMASEFGTGLAGDEGLEERLWTLAARFNIRPPDILALARRVTGRDRSLNQPMPEPHQGEWLDHIADPSPSPEDATIAASENRFWRDLLTQALETLSPREQAIIHRRYLTEAKASFAAIAGDLSLSKERVRQLEAEALRKLRLVLDGTVGARRPAWLQGD